MQFAMSAGALRQEALRFKQGATPMMTHRCERCPRVTDLYYCRSVDEYLCEECADQLADEENEECDA
jgi:hypothetical protein